VTVANPASRRSVSVTRADLAKVVYERISGSRVSARGLVDMMLAEIAEALSRGERVKIASFGSFIVRSKRERVGRNPRTGVEALIVARRIVIFRASDRLRELLSSTPPASVKRNLASSSRRERSKNASEL
jgi:integration host factor subunit alpha